VVLYNYDGLGKRRLKAIGDDTTYWRWDAGYSVLAQYQDTTPDWGISGFDRFFVPFGHTALAEADLDTSGVPANAAYTYLTHDHLGTSTHGFNQSKTVVSQNVHLPFGQRSYVYGNSPYHEFTGKPWDAESQMYYFPYRYYSPNMNRWTGADPAELIDGPNVYEYVRGNPIVSFDPLGLVECCKPERLAMRATCITAGAAIASCLAASVACTACAVACIKFPLACAACKPICFKAAALCVAAAAAVEWCLSATESYYRCVREAKSDPCCDESGG
jgi:RHS repeat-associated protein